MSSLLTDWYLTTFSLIEDLTLLQPESDEVYNLQVGEVRNRWSGTNLLTVTSNRFAIPSTSHQQLIPSDNLRLRINVGE